jgi:hypothetical protein
LSVVVNNFLSLALIAAHPLPYVQQLSRRVNSCTIGERGKGPRDTEWRCYTWLTPFDGTVPRSWWFLTDS